MKEGKISKLAAGERVTSCFVRSIRTKRKRKKKKKKKKRQRSNEKMKREEKTRRNIVEVNYPHEKLESHRMKSFENFAAFRIV